MTTDVKKDNSIRDPERRHPRALPPKHMRVKGKPEGASFYTATRTARSSATCAMFVSYEYLELQSLIENLEE